MENLKIKGVSILRWLERYTKTDMVYLAKGGFWLNLSQVSSAILGLVLTIVFANLVSIETYGIYRYVLSVYSIIIIFSLPGIDTALIRSASRQMDGAFTEGIKTKIRWGYLGGVVSLSFAVYKYIQNDHTLAYIFILIAIIFPVMEAFSLYASWLNGKKLFKTWSLVDIYTQLFSTLCLVVTLFLTEDIFLIILSYFLPIIIGRILATIYVKKKYTSNSSMDPELISYGKTLTFYQIVSRIISSIDQIALFHFLGATQVAIFSLSTAIPSRVQSLFKATGTLAFPKFTESEKGAPIASLPKKMLWLLLIILVVCALYVIASPFIFKYLFPKYLPSLIYSKVVIFYTLSAITYPFSSYLMAHKKIKENYIFGGTNLVVKILTLAVFVPMLGIWGAVISMLSTSLTTILIALVLIYREKTIFSVQ